MRWVGPGRVYQSISLSVLPEAEVSISRSLSYNRMISVADGDPPLLPESPGSVSDSKSTSKSGFVHIIRLVVVFPFTGTRGSVQENAERAMDGRGVRVMVVCSALGRSGCGLERTVKEEGDIGGETRTVFRRATRLGNGGGFGVATGG